MVVTVERLVVTVERLVVTVERHRWTPQAPLLSPEGGIYRIQRVTHTPVFIRGVSHSPDEYSWRRS